MCEVWAALDGVIEARVRVGARLPGATRRVLTFAFFQIKQRFFSRPRAPEGRAPGRREEVIGRWERRGGVVWTYHVGEVHAHGHVAVAAVVLEAVRSEEEGHEGDVGGVHRLEREAVVGAVEVGIGDEILDGLEHLLQEGTLDKTGLKHGDLCLLVYVGGVSVPAWYGPMARSCRKVWENTNLNRLVSKRFRYQALDRGVDTSPGQIRETKKIGCLAAPAWSCSAHTLHRRHDDGLDDDGQRGRCFPEHGRAPPQEGESQRSNPNRTVPRSNRRILAVIAPAPRQSGAPHQP